MKREKILKKIFEEHNKIIENLNLSIRQYKTESDLDENEINDPEDFSRQNEAKDMQLRYEKMLKKEKLNQVFVLSEIEKHHSKIEKGSVIETNKNIFFVGISLPTFKNMEKEIVCFSENAPVFLAFKGKKIGDHLEIGIQNYIIININ